ncbi:ABC transporter permease [Pedobacter panaciterrae]|uniref:ABC transporter permease n=1 Tax=Pedobacter panaciterrae TaxID=363849 RepID=A0ABU8NH59_9SPHI
MFKLNLKIALRNLWKNKGFTLINIGGLGIGLASCMILLLYVAYEWSYDKQFTDFDKTYVVYNNQKTPTETFSFAATPGVLAVEAKQTVPGIEKIARLDYPTDRLITYKQNSFKKGSVFVDADFTKIFDLKVLKGNPSEFLKNPNSIVLTETLAKSLFGDEDPLNKTLKLDNSEELKVEGVVADVPKNSSIQYEFLMPWALYEKLNQWTKDASWGTNFCLTFVQFKDNSFFENANKQFHGMIKSHDKTSNGELFLYPLSKWHLYSTFENGLPVGGKIDQLKIFFLLAFCILLIACVNFMNLSTARSEKRAKEVGVRKAIGSSRKALVGQFMMESMLMALMSMLIAFVLIEISLPYFNSIIGIQLSIDYSNWQFWGTLFSLTVLTGLLSGSYPAFYLSSFAPIKVLKGFTLSGSSSLSVRKGLVVFQFVFAACLIVCTIVIYQQLNYIKNKPIGYNKNNLIEIPIQGNLKTPAKREILKDQLLKSGAVTSVTSFSQRLTAGGNNGYDVRWPGKNLNDKILINFRFTNYDLVKTTGMELVDGRDFSPQFADSTNVLINEALAKIMGMTKPVGSKIKWGNTDITIIGVLKDYVMESPYQKANPVLIAMNDNPARYIIVRLNPDQNVSTSVATIDNTVKKLNPEYPVDRTFVDDSFEGKFANEKLLGTLSNWFGGFAVFISCLGLLGLALYMAEQRKKEISIRKVLGASNLNILTLLNKDFIKLVAIANVIAFPLAYIIINKWLSGYEFKVSISPLPFAIAAILSLIIAVLTVSAQSVKVAKANPIDALKYE